ncbi:MAG TPA: hypothetical protein VH540_26005 [Ktedonobacterales bacterium]|jgi:hypothetical protein
MAKTKWHRYFPHRDPIIRFPADFWSDPDALVTLLRTYLGLGSDAPVFLEDALTLLGDLDTRSLTVEHAGAVLLGRTFLLVLPLIDKRHRQRKRAFGGKDKPLEFDPAELEQTLPELYQLPLRLDALCKWLLDDLWTLLRLMRAAQSLYRRQRQAWMHLHRLIGVVLARILLIWERVRRRFSPWIAYGCLRWALRELWGTLFGRPVHLTAGAGTFLDQEALSIGQEWELWVRLKRENDEGGGVPAPFTPLVERWRAGDTPPPYKEQTEEERIAEARFWL